jgi:class 3 adenylate cyclase/predicted alpha/beta hydrolase
VTDDVRWARCDGHHLAHRIVEVDPASDVTVVLLTGTFIPIDAMWGDPAHARFLDGLARLGRLVVFDRRGVGASDPVADWGEPILHQWARDAAAVVDAVGRGPAHLVGWEWGAIQALIAAGSCPDQVRSVTVLNGIARPERFEDILGMPLEQIGEAMSGWVTGDAPDHVAGEAPSASVYAPSRSDDHELQRWIDDSGRRGVSPMTAARMWRSCCTPGISVDLGAIRAPLLSLHRRDNEYVTRAHAQEIVDGVANAVLVEVPGTDLAPYGGDVDALVAEIASFITGGTHHVSSWDRQLVAVLFTDIVGSTESAVRVGDERWRRTLDAHDRITAQIVGRHGGRIVKHTGDGTLGVFPLASRAARAALELRDALGEHDLQIRQGIHVGEILDRAGDVAGRTVHIAARVLAQAAPHEILTTAAVALVVDPAELTLTPSRTMELRGFEGTWQLHVLEDAGASR